MNPFRRSPRKQTAHAPARPARPRLRLEALEARDNPTATTTGTGGLLDTSFNGTGEEVLSASAMTVSQFEGDVAVQSDGKIVSVGQVSTKSGWAMQVVRLNSDGSLDTSFNGTGLATINVGSGWSEGHAVAIQPDGKILVGGRASLTGDKNGVEDVVARLNANGTLDTTFGNGGRKGAGGGIWQYNPTSNSERVDRLAVLTDSSGNMTGVMVEADGFTSTGRAFAAIKLTASGQTDTTFGTGGVTLVNVGYVNDTPQGMAVTPSGGVVMVGDAGRQGVIVVLTPTGQLDTTFNGTGYRVDQLSPDQSPTTYFDAVAVQPAAGGGYGVVVSGAVTEAGSGNGLVARYTSSGQLDTTFASGGLFTTAATAEFTEVALEADGSVVVSGYAYWTNSSGTTWQQVAVGHLTADGAADTTFGTDGTRIVLLPPLYATGDSPLGLALDPSGRVVVTFDTGASGGQEGFARLTAP